MYVVVTNIRLPAGKEHLEAFLRKHPEDAPLRPALLAIFEGLAHADELGSLLQIEEPVDRELRHLRDQQRTREREAGAAALFGLRKDEDWSVWKHEAIERLCEHFNAEESHSDLATAFFGEAASKGLSLVELLARRYDVVAANPPYMGSKNMGRVLKKHVGAHFASGKRDLYAAFILRCLALTAAGGRVAMVTQQSWLFLRSFAALRALSDDKLKSSPRAFKGLLRESTFEALCHLGPRAFGEIGGEVVNSALFVLVRTPFPPDHHFVAIRAVAAEGPVAKSELLRAAVRNPESAVRTQPQQERFLQIPDSPLPYWLSPSLLKLLSGDDRLSDHAKTIEGLNTTHNRRFLRWRWEIGDTNRWRPYSKGGGYRRWYGNVQLAVDWGDNGAKLKLFIEKKYDCHWSKRVSGIEYYDRQGWNWSLMARGSFGLRLKEPETIFDVRSGGLFVDDGSGNGVAALMCTRPVSYLLRAVSPVLDFHAGYVARLPVPAAFDDETLAGIARSCVQIRKKQASRSLAEWSFGGAVFESAGGGESLKTRFQAREAETQLQDAVCATFEGWLEALATTAFRLGEADASAVLDETGTPAGYHRRVAGYEALPVLNIDSIEVEGAGVAEHLAAQACEQLGAAALGALRNRLRILYANGPGALPVQDDVDRDDEDDRNEDDETSASNVGARVPIPTETFLEELSQKLGVHPLSVYWLLRELREKEGIVSKPELVRLVEDYLSVLVLRLLGHRWPREAKESLPAWADHDGIIPLTGATSDSALMPRIRARLASDFGAERVGAIEREFQEITGKPIAAWLASDFFKRHISQFRQRPIAWQFTSSGVSNAKRRGRGASQSAPAFCCLIYYHRLDADLLPKLRTHYIGPLRTRLQTELGILERMSERSGDQDVRRLELEVKLEELKAFDARLEQVLGLGFASPTLDEIAAKEPLDGWTSRDSRVPETRDAFLAQERRYGPDLNDGVRVNIAPLQRAGLLAADVLAAKDVEKAIADRAEWRADERRWCREGKLPQPGWWPVAANALEVPAEGRLLGVGL